MASLNGDNGLMDDTPVSQSISELTELDPAEAVDAAEALADDLEASLASDDTNAPDPQTQEAEPKGEQPDAPTT